MRPTQRVHQAFFVIVVDGFPAHTRREARIGRVLAAGFYQCRLENGDPWKLHRPSGTLLTVRLRTVMVCLFVATRASSTSRATSVQSQLGDLGGSYYMIAGY